MKDTLLYLVQQLVDHPDDARVEESQEAVPAGRQESRTILTIFVHQEDMGKIIGKSGRIIKALRDLTKLIATKHNAYVDVVLAE